MAEYIRKIRTVSGDLQIDYNYLANLPVMDTTLEFPGKPADAQATGAAIQKLYDALNESNTSINELNGAIDTLGLSVNEQLQQLENNTAANLRKKAETAVYTGTFSSNAWISESTYYTQTIAIDGLLIDDTPLVDIDLSNISDYSMVIENWNFVGRVSVSADNTVVAYCYEDKPVIDIPIILKVIR